MKNKILILPEVYKEVNTGGPFAVIKKMYDIDKKSFRYIKNSKIIERGGKIKKVLPIIKIISEIINIFRYFKYYNIVNNCDIIISHSLISSYFCLKFSNKKVVNIYHGQGDLYNEYTDLLGIKKSKILKYFSNYIESYVYNNSYKIGFPSNGAIEALLATNTSLKQIIDYRIKDINIFYNGILFNSKKTHCNELEKNLINNGYNFVSVATINKAKGVDLIPEFLGNLKKKGIKFTWTIIGQGNQKEKLYKNIEEYNLKDNTFLFEKPFKKSDILGLLSKTDFYILFHRLSIFDLVTIEAMSYGNIPILSNIGGNKEVIIENNGLLVDGIDDGIDDGINNFINNIIPNLDILHKKNIDIVKARFLNKNFIEGYKKIDNL